MDHRDDRGIAGPRHPADRRVARGAGLSSRLSIVVGRGSSPYGRRRPAGAARHLPCGRGRRLLSHSASSRGASRLRLRAMRCSRACSATLRRRETRWSPPVRANGSSASRRPGGETASGSWPRSSSTRPRRAAASGRPSSTPSGARPAAGARSQTPSSRSRTRSTAAAAWCRQHPYSASRGGRAWHPTPSRGRSRRTSPPSTSPPSTWLDRAVDHTYWQQHARRTTWPDAYSYAFPGGDIGPVAGRDATSAAHALRTELARAEGEVRLRIPGSSRALVEVALAAGLRLSPVPGLLLLSDSLAPPTALAIAGYALY